MAKYSFHFLIFLLWKFTFFFQRSHNDLQKYPKSMLLHSSTSDLTISHNLIIQDAVARGCGATKRSLPEPAEAVSTMSAARPTGVGVTYAVACTIAVCVGCTTGADSMAKAPISASQSAEAHLIMPMLWSSSLVRGRVLFPVLTTYASGSSACLSSLLR